MIFDRRLWHARGDNVSDRTRKVLFYGYTHRWIRPRDELSLDPDRLARLTPLRRQLLGFAEDTSDYWFPPARRFAAGCRCSRGSTRSPRPRAEQSSSVRARSPRRRGGRRDVAELDELERLDRFAGDPEASSSSTNVVAPACGRRRRAAPASARASAARSLDLPRAVAVEERSTSRSAGLRLGPNVARGQSRGNQYSGSVPRRRSPRRLPSRGSKRRASRRSSLTCQSACGPSPVTGAGSLTATPQQRRRLGPEEELRGFLAPQPAVLVVLLVQLGLPAAVDVDDERLDVHAQAGLRSQSSRTYANSPSGSSSPACEPGLLVQLPQRGCAERLARLDGRRRSRASSRRSRASDARRGTRRRGARGSAPPTIRSCREHHLGARAVEAEAALQLVGDERADDREPGAASARRRCPPLRRRSRARRRRCAARARSAPRRRRARARSGAAREKTSASAVARLPASETCSSAAATSRPRRSPARASRAAGRSAPPARRPPRAARSAPRARRRWRGSG